MDDLVYFIIANLRGVHPAAVLAIFLAGVLQQVGARRPAWRLVRRQAILLGGLAPYLAHCINES